MFEEPEEPMEKDRRSQLIMVLSGAAVLIVIALIIVVGSTGSKQSAAEIEMSRPGSPEFDAYATSVKVIMTRDDRITAQNLLGNYIATLKARVQNGGDRVIEGLQLRAVAIGLDGNLLKERVFTPIPRRRESLPPNEVLPVEVQLDPIPNPDEIMDLTIEVHALKLRTQ